MNLELGLFVFMLATFVGLEIIRKVSPLLHTPLMSLTNAISAISVVGAILITGASYQPFPDLAVNGVQTLGENIADTAGLTVAFDAYRASLHGAPAPVVDGLTGDQQFFLSFAQAWRQKAREQATRNQIHTDGHAPAMYRAATVRNVDAWYEAFHVEPGQQLYLAPADRAHLW